MLRAARAWRAARQCPPARCLCRRAASELGVRGFQEQQICGGHDRRIRGSLPPWSCDAHRTPPYAQSCAPTTNGAGGERRVVSSSQRAGREVMANVHQILATLGYGDAIGHEVLGIQRALRAAGHSSEIIVETADPRLEGVTVDYRDMVDAIGEDDLVIHHFSIGSRASRTAFALPRGAARVETAGRASRANEQGKEPPWPMNRVPSVRRAGGRTYARS